MPFLQIESPAAAEALHEMRDRDLPWVEFARFSDTLTWNIMEEVVERASLWFDGIEIIAVPILRAGIAFQPALRAHLDRARTGWVGLERKELPDKKVEIRSYYRKFPETDLAITRWVIIDPMLATGSSMKVVIDDLVAMGVLPTQIIAVVCIAAPEALALFEAQPWGKEVRVYGAALDERLDEKCYIVPGLGDYGDRYLGTASGSGLPK